jgi:hypothetical protein
MSDPRFLGGVVSVALVTVIVLAALLLVGVSRPGPRRAGLVAGGLPLALLPPMTAAAYVSWKLVGLFSGAAKAGGGGTRMLSDACGSLELLLRLAWGGFSAACVLGLVLGLVRSGRSTKDITCTARRGAVLVLLPVLGLLVAGTLTRAVASALRVTAAVAASDVGDPESRARADAVLAAADLPTRGSGSIGATARYLARAMMLGTFGGITAVHVLLGLALPGFILAWRVRFGVVFQAFASTAWLLAAILGGAMGFGVL